VTTSTTWKSFGASVIGPGHVATGKPNQDAWASFHHIWGDGIVVSDGLGSKALSDFGSKAACRAVETAARRFADAVAAGTRPTLLEDIREGWLESIAPLDPKDAYATCAFAFRLSDGIVRLGLLGDGCAAAVKQDGTVRSLADDKTSGFSNMTIALTPATNEAQWSLLEVPESECVAVVLCTDGVSDDLDDINGFMTGFVAAHRGLALATAARQTLTILEDWPVPKHSDDKTIACLLREVVSDE
jgi:serine/threonine protein phosphatase PrpC